MCFLAYQVHFSAKSVINPEPPGHSPWNQAWKTYKQADQTDQTGEERTEQTLGSRQPHSARNFSHDAPHFSLAPPVAPSCSLTGQLPCRRRRVRLWYRVRPASFAKTSCSRLAVVCVVCKGACMCMRAPALWSLPGVSDSSEILALADRSNTSFRYCQESCWLKYGFVKGVRPNLQVGES